jgi:hypothetical protein
LERVEVNNKGLRFVRVCAITAAIYKRLAERR